MEDIKKFMNKKNLVIFTISCFFRVLWSMAAIYAMLNIIQSHAYVLTMAHGIWLVIFGLVMCQPKHKLEIIGMSAAIIGVILLLSDPSAEREDGKVGNWLVYGVALGGGLCAAIYFKVSSMMLTGVPIWTMLLA